jgi:hypothetical protein
MGQYDRLNKSRRFRLDHVDPGDSRWRQECGTGWLAADYGYRGP